MGLFISINDACRCLHDRHLVALAKEMNIPMPEFYEVATFCYHFETRKDGEATPGLKVRVCGGLAFELAGAQDLLARLPALLGAQAVRVVADLWIVQQMAAGMGLDWHYEGEHHGVAAVYEEKCAKPCTRPSQASSGSACSASPA